MGGSGEAGQVARGPPRVCPMVSVFLVTSEAPTHHLGPSRQSGATDISAPCLVSGRKARPEESHSGVTPSRDTGRTENRLRERQEAHTEGHTRCRPHRSGA